MRLDLNLTNIMLDLQKIDIQILHLLDIIKYKGNSGYINVMLGRVNIKLFSEHITIASDEKDKSRENT